MSLIPPPPPSLSALPAGYLLRAGLGFAEVLPTLDMETYSEAGYVWDATAQKWRSPAGCNDQKRGLKAVGAAVYSEHPTAEILIASYDLKDGRGVRRWRMGEPFPQDLADHIANGGLIESHNAGFEFWMWWNVWHLRYGYPMIPGHQQRCSMAKCRAWALPGGLEEAGRVMGLALQKDSAGKDLMKRFSMPRNPTKANGATREYPSNDPLSFERYHRYCDRDVEAESELSSKVPDLTASELEWWHIDQAINRLGVQVDLTTVRAGIRILEQAFEVYNAELREITGGAVERASELAKLKQWLHSQGVHLNGMTEGDIEAELERISELVQDGMLPEHEAGPAHRALEIRALIGSASVKKLYSMLHQATRRGRLHELFNYHAARTGRATGNDPQPTNLPNSGPDVAVCMGCGRHHGTHRKDCPWCGAPTLPAPPPPLPNRMVVEWCAEAAADAIEIIRTGSLTTLESYFGGALAVISACLRGMFIAAPGHELISSDYTAIEAVVLAELAGE